MYRAKDLGRGQYQIFTSKMYQAARQLLSTKVLLQQLQEQAILLVIANETLLSL